jgi:hypothetical protein
MGGANRRGGVGLKDPYKPISSTGYGFDVPRLLGGIPLGRSQLIHRCVEALLEVDERSFAPDLVAELVPSNDLARVLEQNDQNRERLTGQPDANAALEQLAGRGIHFERPKRLTEWQFMERPHNIVVLTSVPRP